MIRILKNIDWLLYAAAAFITIVGIITMNSFTGDNNFATRQIVWLCLSSIVFFLCSAIDWRFLRSTTAVTSVFFLSVALLVLLTIIGSVFKGAQSWFNLGAFAFQPTDFAKLGVILVLSKYFARRHVEIAHIRHIIVSGLYAFIVFVLVFMQPDFGSAVVVMMIWLGMVLVSGISKKHLLLVFLVGVTSVALLWNFGFKDYQKQRVLTFLHPLADIRGAGYNAYQSTIAVGSGELMGKGIGYGTQSKLKFLPEYRTDFIFAAYAEEWGFVGVIILFSAYGVLIYRVLSIAYRGETNFEILYGLGIAILFISHFMIHVGMNIGILPVTGLTLSFMSYGGSHLISEFFALGILMGMKRYAHAAHKERMDSEPLQMFGARDL